MVSIPGGNYVPIGHWNNDVPKWASGLTGASALGVALLDDPVGFVQAVVVQWFLRGILTFVGEIGALIITLIGTVTGAFVDAGVALGIPGQVLADLVENGIWQFRSLLWEIALQAGPFAPFVVLAMGAVGAFMLAFLLRIARKAILGLLQWQ